MVRTDLFLEAAGPWAGKARIGTSTRRGGVSRPPYACLNLGAGTGDGPEAVAENRRRLAAALHLPAEPFWLRQVHGTRVVRASRGPVEPEEADGAWTDEPGVVLAVLTADCVPVVVYVPRRGCLAVAHAGWRGLARGVLEATLEAIGGGRGAEAWIGPAIDPALYEVGPEVREALLTRCPTGVGHFRPARDGRFFCDLPALTAQHLHALGVERVVPCGRFTSETELFYSYRRERETGRQAALAWLLAPPPAPGAGGAGLRATLKARSLPPFWEEEEAQHAS